VDVPLLVGQISEHPGEALSYAVPATQHAAVRDEDRIVGVVADDVIEVAGDHRLGIPDHGALQRLTGIRCPTLIIQGDGDQMIPTKLSHLMAGLIPDTQIRIYDDAAHAFLFQYPEQVAADVGKFLD
jgi:pimeloyl-ACP methyl ester carboxylesterase